MRANLSTFDELEWLEFEDIDSELEDAASTRFTYDGVPRVVRYLLSIGEVQRALDECVRRGKADPKTYPGYLDTNFLSDLVFFKLYPRDGRFISRDEADYEKLSQVWLGIRDTEVTGALSRAGRTSERLPQDCYRPSGYSFAPIARVGVFYDGSECGNCLYDDAACKLDPADHTAAIEKCIAACKPDPADPTGKKCKKNCNCAFKWLKLSPEECLAELVEGVLALGVTDLYLAINTQGENNFETPSTMERLRTAAALAPVFCERRVDVHLMTWLDPSDKFLVDAERNLRAICDRAPIRSLSFDLEDTWGDTLRPPGVSVAVAVEKAKALLNRSWRFKDWPCPLGVTSTADLRETVVPVIERCDYVLPQAYSEVRTNEEDWPRYNPGTAQQRVQRIWGKLGKDLVMGLTATRLKLQIDKKEGDPSPRKLTVTEAMKIAIVTTEQLQNPAVEEVVYWSYTAITHPRNTEHMQFVKGAAAKARLGRSQR